MSSIILHDKTNDKTTTLQTTNTTSNVNIKLPNTNGTILLKEDLDKLLPSNDVTGKIKISVPKIKVTVGPSDADFTTINDAIKYLDSFIPSFNNDRSDNHFQFPFQIILKTGFVMNEQVHLYSKDYGHISISHETDGTVVTVKPSALKLPSLGFGQYSYTACRAVFYIQNGVSPCINFKFRLEGTYDWNNISGDNAYLDSSKTILKTSLWGVHWDNSSKGCIGPKGGVENFYWAAFASNASTASICVSTYRDNWSSVCADNSSIVNAQYVTVTNNVGIAIWTAESSVIDCTGSTIDGCKGTILNITTGLLTGWDMHVKNTQVSTRYCNSNGGIIRASFAKFDSYNNVSPFTAMYPANNNAVNPGTIFVTKYN